MAQEPGMVEERGRRPTGVLPRNTQAWVIIGIAVLMLLVIGFGGTGPKPKPPEQPRTPTAQLSQAITSYQKQIQEQTAKLQAEQQRLQAAQQTAQGTLQVPGQPGTLLEAHPQGGGQPVTPEQQLALDRKRREYTSLFSSNVALSYRSRAAVTSPRAPELAAVPTGTANSPAAAGGPVQAQPSADPLQAAEGKDYRIFEGTIIETVLTNRLNGAFSGPVNCMVTSPVYSHDHQHILIPKGSRILGEVGRVQGLDQERLAVSFHRIVMPDGFSVDLDRFTGMNQIGETGLKDKVNHHYLQIFGASVAVGALAGLSQISSYSAGYNSNSGDLYRQGFSNSISQSALRIIDRFLNILPAVTIREGHRVKVWITQDLLVPAYENHRLPAGL